MYNNNKFFDENNEAPKKLSAFQNVFPSFNKKKENLSSSSTFSSLSSVPFDEDEKHIKMCNLQEKLDLSTKFAFADLLISVLKLDFFQENDKSAINFCKKALNVVLKWCTLPEKTKETLRHHMQDEGNINDDLVTLINAIKADNYLKQNGFELILASLLVSIIVDGDYDSRFRVLLRHVSALLGIEWNKFEKLEETLADHLANDYVESENSKKTRERLAKSKKLKRYALIGAASGLGGVLIGLTGGLSAPFLAAGMGAITASTTFAGLASTTGAAILGSLFGVAGGGLAGYKMKKRVGAIKEFVVETLSDEKNASLHCVLCVSGWINENEKYVFQKPWRHLWMSKEQYTLRYESNFLVEWGKSMDYFVSIAVGYAIQRSLMETVLAGII